MNSNIENVIMQSIEKLDKEEERFDKKLHPQKITKQVKKDKTRTLSDILKKKVIDYGYL